MSRLAQTAVSVVVLQVRLRCRAEALRPARAELVFGAGLPAGMKLVGPACTRARR